MREISEKDLSGGGLLKASQEYRRRLAHFKTRNDTPVETRLELLQRHLFRRKFGYAILDEDITEPMLENCTGRGINRKRGDKNMKLQPEN